MAPVYFFYNLPSSESKDILQDMLDLDDSRKRKEQQKALTISSSANSSCEVNTQTYDRCVVQ